MYNNKNRLGMKIGVVDGKNILCGRRAERKENFEGCEYNELMQ
jgi:hypothetical protein